MIKAVLSDFDGTLVTKDILDVVCGIVGKEVESRKLNEEFQRGLKPGIPTLIQRINFLQGVTLHQITEKLEIDQYLMPGTRDWINFLKVNQIKIILYSGNIEPILKYYQELLDIDYIIGTKPEMDGVKITGISIEDFTQGNWKLIGIEAILEELNIRPEEALAIGDSRADIPIFEYAGKSIAINPKGEEIKKAATYIIDEDLTRAIEIVKKEMH